MRNKLSLKRNGLSDLLRGLEPEEYVSEYGNIREYYLSDEIGSPDEYVSMIHDIRNAGENDVIKLHINCPGGNLFTTIQIVQAMAECSGTIIASVEGACMSAATIIFLYADEFIVGNHSMFLFHNYSGGTFGKGAEMYHGVIHQRKWSENLMRDHYGDFLTENEINDLIEDKDIWMDSSQVLDRLLKRNKIIEKKAKTAKKKKSQRPAFPENALIQEGSIKEACAESDRQAKT